MSHIGLQPQKISNSKNFKVLGKLYNEERKVIKDLKSVENAGSFSVVLESVTENLANKVNKISKIPVIGIGASNKCDGQILVTEDLLGLLSKSPKFAKKYESFRIKIRRAVTKYSKEVKTRKFPSKYNTFR
tara:strand:- start:111 stop:503 length:393 start_codon:yes stop_codon:yes gene_type:complete